MFKKRDQQLLAEAYEAILSYGDYDWKKEYKEVVRTVYSNLSRAENARRFFGMFGQPGYLVRALNQAQDAARESGVYLQNDPLFGKLKMLVDALKSQRNDDHVDMFFNEEKPGVQNVDAKINEIYNNIDRM